MYLAPTHSLVWHMWVIQVLFCLACALAVTQTHAEPMPNLEGFWDYRTATPLETPATLGDRNVFSDAEVVSFESGSEARALGFVKSLGGFVGDEPWADRGQLLTEGNRASLIIDPSSGRLPQRTEYGRTLAGGWKRQMMAELSGPEDRTVLERCVYNPVTPVRPSFFNNNLRIVQTPEHVLIHTEMIHEARIVRIVKPPVQHTLPSSYRGESLGYWDDGTLVIKTRGFEPHTNHLGTSTNLILTERITLDDVSDQLIYEFTVNDPKVFTSPWTARQTLSRLDGIIYEYACHEGNSMDVMLRGARMDDANRR